MAAPKESTMKQELEVLKAKFRALSTGAKIVACALAALFGIGGSVELYHLHSVSSQMGGLIEDTNKIHVQQHGGSAKFGANVDHSTTSIHGGHTLVTSGDSLGGFMSGADKTKLDGIATGAQVVSESNVRTASASFSADPSFNSHKITSLADGTAASDSAAFHQIADAVLAAKANAVDAVSSGNLTLSGTQTVDGVALVAGNRCLPYGQTTTTQDGCYVVAAGAWSRCTDFPTGTGAADRCFVARSGTSNKGVWCATNASGSDVIGTADLVFTNVAAGGGGGSIGGTLGATDNVVPRSDGTGAATLQSSALVISDTGVASGITFNDPTTAQQPVTLNYFDLSRGPNTETGYTEEFDKVSLAITANTFIPGSGGFLCASSGTSSCAVTTSTSTERGLVRFSATSSTAIIGFSHGTSSPPYSLVDNQVWYQEYRGRLNQISDGTNTFTWHFGLGDAQTASPNNCAEFRTNASANFQFAVNKASAGVVLTDTGVPVDTAYHRFELTKAASGNLIGKIDGVDVTAGGTAFASLPTVQMNDQGYLLKSLGAGAVTFDSDWARLRNKFPTPRAN